MKLITKQIKDTITFQALEEIDKARLYKQGKVNNWQKNEAMYFGKKLTTSEARANVGLGQMQEFVHTLLSKIDNPFIFKFIKRKNSQLKRVEMINSLRKIDADKDNWDLKDVVGKKQAILYGRAIYAYYADSIEGYKAHLEPVDVYDFLIDPSVSGIDMETAMYLGRWGIVKTVKDLQEGVKNKIYDKRIVNEIIERADEDDNQEETNKLSRSYDVSTIGKKTSSRFKFWEWFTTYEGERYYILMTNSGEAIRIEKLKNIFKSELYPFWSWASFPDLTEFWTPSYCDYAREIFMAQEVSINQMLDNSEAINKPQKVVNINDIEDLSMITKYRKNGIIPVKAGVDVNKAIQFIRVPSIDSPMKVYQALQSIQDRASGVTAGASGVADESGKVGIYEGNQINTADRFGLLNKSYSFGYKKFARLYENGIKEHLIKKVAINILGPEGVELLNINRNSIYKKNDTFGLIVEANDAEITNSLRNQKIKTDFLMSQAGNPLINQSKVFEIGAKVSGLSEDEIRELLDVNNFGDEKLMSEADRDIENLLNGEPIEPNDNANNAYKQKMVNYIKDHKENISEEQFKRISIYIDSLEEIIMNNEARKLGKEINKNLDAQVGEFSSPGQINKDNVIKQNGQISDLISDPISDPISDQLIK